MSLTVVITSTVQEINNVIFLKFKKLFIFYVLFFYRSIDSVGNYLLAPVPLLITYNSLHAQLIKTCMSRIIDNKTISHKEQRYIKFPFINLVETKQNSITSSIPMGKTKLRRT